LTAAELPGLTMIPPTGFTGDYDLTVTAKSTESSNSDTATTTASAISVSITGPQVAPEVSGSVDLGATNEDAAIVITEAELLANATDGNNDTLSVTGLSLQNGAHGTLTDHGDGTWTFTPAADFSGDDVALDYSVSDGTDSTAASAVIDVTAVADAPALSGSVSAEGYQDNAEPVAVPQEIIDTGNAVTVTGVPSGATLSAGTNNGGGSWTVANADLDGLMLIPNGNTGAVTLNFDAGTSATEIFSADFDSGLDGFSYSDDAFHDGEGGFYDTESGSRASGSADSSGGVGGSGGLELDLGGTGDDGTTDMAGGFTTTFTVPEGATGTLTFSYRIEMDASYESDEYVEVLASVDGTLHGTGGNNYVARMYDGGDSGWQTVSIDLGTLTPGTHTLTIGGYNNKATQSSETAEISFDNVAISTDSTVTGSVGLTLESGIALDISAALSDTDGSESLAVEISGVPTGATLSAGTDLGGGVWSVDSADLSGLTIDPPDSYNGSFDLTVKATATESANSDTEVSSATITVDVKALTDTSSAGTPGQITSGTSGDDTLNGTGEDDQLLGLAGDDTITGGAGADTITGGEGDDLLYGGDGDDLFIFAEGDGQNTVEGGGGSWTDTIQLEGFDGQSAEQGWTLALDSGDSITGTGADYLDLSADSSGTITFDDGTEIVFEGIDKIVW
ncbi:MAG: cadherin-like domain-containing protein, partial [Sphingomonadales bacterium]|nr:cadherin-like domain-containing protein [Sphingomonadales bacterium]